MPSLSDIRRFNQSLVALGDEPSVVQSWGEELEEVEAPDEGLDSELSDLLGDEPAADGAIPDLDDLPEPPPADDTDFLDDLTSEALDTDDLGSTPEPSDELDADLDADAGESFADEAAGDLGALDDLFGDAFDEEPDEPTEEEEPADAVASDDETPADELGPDEFDADAFDLEGFSGVPEDEDAADEAAADEAAAGEAGGDEPAAEEPAGAEDEFGLGDLEDAFGLDDTGFGDLDDEEPIAEEPAGGDDEFDLGADDLGGDESFDMGGADDFALPDDEGAADEDAFGLDDADFGDLDDEEPIAEEPAGGDEEFDLGTDDLGGDESIDLSDDDDLSLPEDGLSFDDESGVLDDDIDGLEFSDEEPFGGDADQTASSDDDFSFDMPGGEEPTDDMFSGGGEGGDDFDTSAGDFSMDEASSLDEVGDDELDEFSLGDFGAEFGVLEEAPETEEDLNPALNVPEVSPGVPETDAGVEISEEDFAKLQATLAGYPLNLKLEVEQLIAEEKGNPAEVAKIVRMLVAGDTPQAMAQAAGKILDKRIRIPRGYEKRTGEDFEEERNSLAYQFREHILPALRVAALVAVALGVLGVTGYNLIYRPLRARNLYQQGLAFIDEQQYALGNETFVAAREVWEADQWFYTYAERFAEQRQYRLAQRKYAQLLFGMTDEELEMADALLRNGEYALLVRRNEPPKQGILDYAQLESEVLGNYAKADRLLRLILVRSPQDYEAWLGRGDNYMRWGEASPQRLDDARQAYARLIQRYGDTDELLFRMLGYFMAVDNLDEVLNLAEVFQNDPEAAIEPQIYSDLAGYLIDKNELAQVEDILFRTMDVDSRLPDPHYHLARYYRRVREVGEERIALQNALSVLEFAQPLDTKRLPMLIDTHIRIGENHFDEELYLDAQDSYEQAIELYDSARSRDLLGGDPKLARVYARLGDIHYYVARDFGPALERFNQAEALGFSSPVLDYKQGFVLYRSDEYNDALEEFRNAETSLRGNDNLLYSIANTYYQRRNYYAAEAYYRELIDMMEQRRDHIRTLLLDEDSEHRSVVEFLYKTTNNLGVTLYHLHNEQGDEEKYSEALVYLTESSEIAENYRRDPETLVRSQTANLAYLNQRELLYPRDEYEPQIYAELPIDPDVPLF